MLRVRELIANSFTPPTNLRWEVFGWHEETYWNVPFETYIAAAIFAAARNAE